MTPAVSIEPAVLEWALARSNHSPTDHEVIRRFERLPEWLMEDPSVRRSPTLKNLTDFADFTRTPLGLLMASRPPQEELPIPDYRTMGDRALDHPSTELLDVLYRCQLRQSWFRTYQLRTESSPASLPGRLNRSMRPDQAAGILRELLELDARPLRRKLEDARKSLCDRLENLGVLVMRSSQAGAGTNRPLEVSEFRGFALQDEYAPVVFVNTGDAISAQIFTLLHETVHVCVGESGIDGVMLNQRHSQDHERWCNAVAAETLVPSSSLRSQHDPRAPLREELRRLRSIFSVSEAVLLRRLYDNEFISWELFSSQFNSTLNLNDKKEERNGGGDFYRGRLSNAGCLFADAILADTFEGNTLYRDAMRLLMLRSPEQLANLHNTLRGNDVLN